MGFSFGNAIASVQQEAGPHTLACLKKLGLELQSQVGTVSTLVQNNRTRLSHASLTDLDYASSGHTGFASSIDLSTHIGNTSNPHATTLEQAMTAGATASTQPTFNGGISLGTSGVAKSAVTSTGLRYDLDMTVSQASGNALKLRNSADSKELMVITSDGRYAFGYGTSLSPNAGHVLSFAQATSSSAAGAPIFAGILASVTHDNTETITRLAGLVGQVSITDSTNMNAVNCVGITSSVACSADSSFAGKILACYSGAISQTGGQSTAEPITKDIAVTMNIHPKGAFDHLTIYWAPHIGMSSATGIPTNKPGIISSHRGTIQGWGASTTVGTPAGEYWAYYGEHIADGAASFPAVSGFLRCTYPRNTGGTGARALHQWWEPWPNTVAIRGGAAEGDLYFDDNTNFTGGLWEFSGIAGGANAWNYLLSSPGVDALGGGAAPTLGTIGGTGPAAAAQATWIKVNCADNVVRWVPAWV